MKNNFSKDRYCAYIFIIVLFTLYYMTSHFFTSLFYFPRFTYLFYDISSKLIITKFHNTLFFLFSILRFLPTLSFPSSLPYFLFFFFFFLLFFVTLPFLFSWMFLHSLFIHFQSLFLYSSSSSSSSFYSSFLHFSLHFYFIFSVLIKNFPKKSSDVHSCVEFYQPAHTYIHV